MIPNFTPSPRLYPFRSRWAETSAGRVHYVDEGQGRPVLFLHGNPTWSFLYRNLIQALRGDFRCVAVDYPGFGLSERPAGYGYTPAEHAAVVGEVVDQLGLDGLVVMGHDWGGPIGLSVAAARAERVAGLILGNTWFWPSELRARVFSAVMSSRPMQRAIVERNLFVERLVPSGVVRTLSDDEMEHYRGVQARPRDRRGIAELPRQIVTAAPWLAELEITVPARLGDKPVLVTWPGRDVAFPTKRTLPRLRAAFRDVTVVELPRAKHFFLEDDEGTCPRQSGRGLRRSRRSADDGRPELLQHADCGGRRLSRRPCRRPHRKERKAVDRRPSAPDAFGAPVCPDPGGRPFRDVACTPAPSGSDIGARQAARGVLRQPQACLRSSPLPKRYGWGLVFDGEGRVALLAMESAEYRRLLAPGESGPAVLKALRSTRSPRDGRG